MRRGFTSLSGRCPVRPGFSPIVSAVHARKSGCDPLFSRNLFAQHPIAQSVCRFRPGWAFFRPNANHPGAYEGPVSGEWVAVWAEFLIPRGLPGLREIPALFVQS